MSVTSHLYYGDYRSVLSEVKANLILTSPPYNIGSKQARQDGFRRLGRYDPKSYGAIRDYPDTLPEPVYQEQQKEFLLWCAAHLTDNGVLVYNHKPRRRNGSLLHPGAWFLHSQVTRCLQLMEEIIWDRGSTHNHCKRLMWPHTERLYVFLRRGNTYRFLNDEQLPYRSDLWRIERSARNGHNAPFPLQLASAVIQAWSRPGELVCDPFAGSGTTALAARALGRGFVGAEIIEKYYELACERLQCA
jgi:DNA modification methylase